MVLFIAVWIPFTLLGIGNYGHSVVTVEQTICKLWRITVAYSNLHIFCCDWLPFYTKHKLPKGFYSRSSGIFIWKRSVGLLLCSNPQLALAMTNTWTLKYLVRKQFSSLQHNPCLWTLPYLQLSLRGLTDESCQCQSWQHAEVTSKFPLHCYSFYFVSAAQLSCSQTGENQYVSAFVSAYEKHKWVHPDRRYHTAPCHSPLHIT